MNDMANSPMNSSLAPERIDFNTPALQRKRRIRALKDRLTRWYVLVGGLAVLAAITLIFFYLAYVVLPLFRGADLETREALTPAWMQQAQVPLLLSIEEQNQVAMRVGGQGEILFFNAKTGVELKRVALPLPAGSEIRSIAQDQPGSPTVALGLSNGQVLVFQHTYKVTYPDNKKTITPEIAFPYGETPIGLDPQGRPLEHVSINAGDDSLLLAGSVDKQLLLLSMTREENMLTGESTLDEERIELPQIAEPVKAIYLDPRKQWLYVINGRATADVFDLHSRQLNGRYKLLEDPNAEVTASTQLLGGISLLVGDSKGGIAQWFMARDTDGEPRLSHVRDFNLDGAPISAIAPEQRRKGFIALDEKGNLGVFHSTAHRTLLVQPVADSSGVITLSPRANRLLLEQGGKIHRFALSNPHPEISWSALWGKVWYESYDKPAYVWQSTAATTDFEPKLSLSPLTFGTLKAAFYAMILAAPLAIAAAVYTAYFMAPAMRRKVKPVIELMEALPTVILGFFAGLFLAPYVEGHLPGVFSLLLLTPLGILLAGLLWSRLPERIRLSLPAGWEAALLIPVVLAVGAFSPVAEPAPGDHLLRRRHAPLAEPRPGHHLRPAQCPDRRAGNGLRGDPEYLLDRRGRYLQRAAQPHLRLPGPGRHALADADPRGDPDRQSRHLLGADDRHGPRRRRDHDRADGDRQYPGDGSEYLRGDAHPGGQRRGGDARVGGRRQPLPRAVPLGAGTADVHLRDEHPGRADPSASAQEIRVVVSGGGIAL